MEELYRSSLVDVVRRMASGELSSETYVRALLQRCRDVEEGIQAWAQLDAEGAVRRARDCDARIRAGRLPGGLRGDPVGVEDVACARGSPPGIGAPSYAK